jgi:hypothetical protein
MILRDTTIHEQFLLNVNRLRPAHFPTFFISIHNIELHMNVIALVDHSKGEPQSQTADHETLSL